MTLEQAIAAASRSVTRRDAETLLLHVLGRDRAWLRAYPEAQLSAEANGQFSGLIARRAAHAPLQYLTGHQEFFGLEFEVNEHVLIPRPETEILVEAVLDWLCEASLPTPRLVDVGTGTGAIALSLAAHLPGAEITAVDLSEPALNTARGNAQRLGLAERVRFLPSDLLAAVASKGSAFDAVISNPPYVPVVDAASLQPEVRDFEPHLALFAGHDGLAVYRRLLPEARESLRPGGLLAMEFGFGQQPALQAMLQGWREVCFREDYAGIPRVALALRP